MGTIDRYKYLFVVNDRMKRVIAVHTLFDSQPDGPVHVCMCVYMSEVLTRVTRLGLESDSSHYFCDL